MQKVTLQSVKSHSIFNLFNVLNHICRCKHVPNTFSTFHSIHNIVRMTLCMSVQYCVCADELIWLQFFPLFVESSSWNVWKKVCFFAVHLFDIVRSLCIFTHFLLNKYKECDSVHQRLHWRSIHIYNDMKNGNFTISWCFRALHR